MGTVVSRPSDLLHLGDLQDESDDNAEPNDPTDPDYIDNDQEDYNSDIDEEDETDPEAEGEASVEEVEEEELINTYEHEYAEVDRAVPNEWLLHLSRSLDEIASPSFKSLIQRIEAIHRDTPGERVLAFSKVLKFHDLGEKVIEDYFNSNGEVVCVFRFDSTVKVPQRQARIETLRSTRGHALCSSQRVAAAPVSISQQPTM
ncbi:hypothetical protein BDZ85DRAFT_311343 [Elsinoe ampelina]|uniref:Uncharacterized protein n=1 Tax=Elsinoe ampelina TaxID=302913 RepID=A0A6A6GCY6_9PEZI|nr:hypothetical protein BDZ85DRAFT_311343 [Elsinoe ampelina]